MNGTHYGRPKESEVNKRRLNVEERGKWEFIFSRIKKGEDQGKESFTLKL